MANGLISPVRLSSRADPDVGVRWSGGVGGGAPNGCSGGVRAARFWSGRPESNGGIYGGWRPLLGTSKPGGQRTAQQVYVSVPNHCILGNARLLIG